MSESKVFMFPDGYAGNNGLDPNLLLSTVMNNGGFGGNGNWIWIIFLLLLFGRNGFGNNDSIAGTGYLSNLIQNGTGRDLLMLAINHNGDALNTLASTLNCDINSVKTAINAVQSAICQVGNQVGMSAADVKNAVTMGNMNIAQLIAQCCCDNKLLVTSQGYENQLATLNQTNVLQNAINQNTVNQLEGFTTVTFQNLTQAANTQRAISDGVQGIKDATTFQTNSILAKLDAIEDDRKNRQISDLTAQLTAANSRAERAAELSPIYKALNDIQCKLVSTVTVPNPSVTAIPSCVAWNTYGPYGAFWNNQGGSIWS